MSGADLSEGIFGDDGLIEFIGKMFSWERFGYLEVDAINYYTTKLQEYNNQVSSHSLSLSLSLSLSFSLAYSVCFSNLSLSFLFSANDNYFSLSLSLSLSLFVYNR